MRKINSLEAWAYFVAIVEEGGLIAAAEKLGADASTMSRTMRSLEEEIGACLWDRSTRPATLSILGEQVYEKAKALLEEQRNLESFLFEDKNSMSGSIRICAQPGLGAKALTEHMVRFLQIYPDVHFELFDQVSDIASTLKGNIKTRADIVFGYYGELDELGLEKIFCGTVPFIACANKDYLAKYGTPATPADCVNHRGILVQSSVRSSTNELTKGKMTLPLSWKSTIIVPNPFAAQHTVKIGGGIMPDMSLWHADPYLTSGEWQIVMPGWQRPPLDAYLYVTKENFEKKRIRTFVEWLAERSRSLMHGLEVKYPHLYRV